MQAAWSISGTPETPMTVNRMESPKVIRMAEWTARRTVSLFCAPKNWEMTTPQPLASPIKKKIRTLMTGATVPTAEKASSLTKFPTTQVSTIL